MTVLVLGLGNVLCGDDSLGVAAIDALQTGYEIPDDVHVMDGGTLGLALLPHLQDAETAVLVDAVASDIPPGSLVRLEGEAVLEAARERLSVHQIGVVDLLQAAELTGRAPSRLVLLGLVPADTSLGLARSTPVEAALPSLVATLAEELLRLGIAIRPREPTDVAHSESAPRL